MQGQFGGGDLPFPSEATLETLDAFAKFGRAVQVTEFDYNCPNVVGFDGKGWRGATLDGIGAMLRRDGTPKPNVQVYEELVLRQR